MTILKSTFLGTVLVDNWHGIIEQRIWRSPFWAGMVTPFQRFEFFTISKKTVYRGLGLPVDWFLIVGKGLLNGCTRPNDEVRQHPTSCHYDPIHA
jgi:hypothetical protein